MMPSKATLIALALCLLGCASLFRKGPPPFRVEPHQTFVAGVKSPTLTALPPGLAAEIQALGPTGGCSMEGDGLVCPDGLRPAVESVAAASGALQTLPNGNFQVSDPAALAAFLARMAAPRAHVAERRTISALASLRQIPGLERGRLYADWMRSLDATIARARESVRDGLQSIRAGSLEAGGRLAREGLGAVPELEADASLRTLAQAAAEPLNQTIRCALSVAEPAGGAYVQGGLDGPLRITVSCAPGTSGLELALRAADAVRFQNSGGVAGGSPEWRAGLSNEAGAPAVVDAYVIALSMDASKNAFDMRVERRLHGVPGILARLGATVSGLVEVEPARYAIRKVPTAYSAEYAERSAGAPASGEVVMLQSGDVQAAVAANGRFSLGVTRGGEPKDLMFGHPNGRYAEGIWSSFVTVRVDDRTYRWDELEERRQVPGTAGHTRLEGRVPGTQILVALQLAGQSATEHSFRLTLEARNGDSAQHAIGFRVLLDTWAGDNDGVPFTIPGAPAGENYIYTREVKFNAAASPIWETYNPVDRGTVYLQSRAVGPGLVPPDEVAFANWGTAYSSEWEYPVNQELFITGDSAVLSWWHPLSVPAGGLRTVTTEYRSVVRSRQAVFELFDPNNGFGVVYLRYTNETAARQTVDFAVRATGSEVLLLADGPLRFELEPGAELFRAVPVLLVGLGAARLKVERTVSGSTVRREATVQLSVAPRAILPPMWHPTRAYPIRFVSEKGNLQLFGRLREATSGRVLGVVRLLARRDGTLFIYEGAVGLPTDYAGATEVEIYEE